MKRVVLRDDEGNFVGWVNRDTATEIASYKRSSGLHIYGKILYHTPKHKLFVNEWNNSGLDVYRTVEGNIEIAEILAESFTDGTPPQYMDILNRSEL